MSIILKVNNSTETLENHVIPKGKSVHVKAQPGVNYAIVNDNGSAPSRITTKRVGKNLHILLDDDTSPDIIIDGYFNADGNLGSVIGQAADGKYYSYAIEGGSQTGSAVLGGGALTSPLAMASDEGGLSSLGLSNGTLGALGVLGVGLIGGGIAVAASGGGDNGNNKAPVPPASKYNTKTGIISGNGATPGSTVTATLPDGTETSAVAKPNGSYKLPPFQPVPSNHETITVNVDNKISTIKAPDTTPIVGGYDPITGVIAGKGATPGSKVTATLVDGTKISGVVKPDGSYNLAALNPKPGNGDAITITADNEKVVIKATVVEIKSDYNPQTGVVSGTGATPGSTIKASLPDGTWVSAIVKPDGTYVLPPFNNAPNNGGSITVSVDGKPSAFIKTPDNTDIAPEYNSKTGVLTGKGATPGSTITATLPDGSSVSSIVKPDGSYSLPAFSPVPVNGETIKITAGNENISIKVADSTEITSSFNANTGTVNGNGATAGSTVTATLPNGTQVSAIVKPNGSYTLPAFSPIPANGETITVKAGTEVTTVTATDSTPVASSYQPATGVITGTGATPGKTVTATLPDGTQVSAIVKPNGSYTLPAFSPIPANGETITVTAAGETATISVTDTTAPTQPSVPVVIANSNGTLSASGTAEPGSTVKVTFPDGTTGTAVATTTGAYGPIISSAPQSSGSVKVTATDAAGNISQIATKAYTDTTAPIAPATNNMDADGKVVTGTAEAGSTVKVTDESGNVLGTALAGPDGKYSVALNPAVTNGSTLSVTATDESGNSSVATLVASVVVEPLCHCLHQQLMLRRMVALYLASVSLAAPLQ